MFLILIHSRQRPLVMPPATIHGAVAVLRSITEFSYGSNPVREPGEQCCDLAHALRFMGMIADRLKQLVGGTS
jgi:hypothetical protein